MAAVTPVGVGTPGSTDTVLYQPTGSFWAVCADAGESGLSGGRHHVGWNGWVYDGGR